MNNDNFDTLEKILYSHSQNRIIPGLERITSLLERLGNPQNSFKSVHIVGTNGKGSTGAFISSVLRHSGYKTGFYSSPHLESPGERLLVDGKALSPSEWIDAAERVCAVIGSEDEMPSYFELLTACAFVLMRDAGIEAGVIEAGLGGRLDATNTMNNTACTVIASISIDHTEYLGPTLSDIAREKFAVIRGGVPACFAGADESVVPMFKERCREVGVLPFVVSEYARAENVTVSPEGNMFDFHSPYLELEGVKTKLIGYYQVSNAMLALSAISLMRKSFPKITEASIRTGMLCASWPGRLEIISREPDIVLDGGHNYDGVKKLCVSVRDLWPGKNIGIVYAAMKDKDFKGCLGLLSEYLGPRIYLTTVPGMPRAMGSHELAEEAESFRWFNQPEGYDEPEEAVNAAVNDDNEVVIVCGSLYLVGYVRKRISRIKEA